MYRNRGFNRSFDVLDDFNGFMSNNAPQALISGNSSCSRNNNKYLKKRVSRPRPLPYKYGQVEEIDWDYEIRRNRDVEIKKERERHRNIRYNWSRNHVPVESSWYDWRNEGRHEPYHEKKRFDYRSRPVHRRNYSPDRSSEHSRDYRSPENRRKSKPNIIEIVDLTDLSAKQDYFNNSLSNNNPTNSQDSQNSYHKEVDLRPSRSSSNEREHDKKFTLSSSSNILDKNKEIPNSLEELKKAAQEAARKEEADQHIKELKTQMDQLKLEINKLQSVQVILQKELKERPVVYTDYTGTEKMTEEEARSYAQIYNETARKAADKMYEIDNKETINSYVEQYVDRYVEKQKMIYVPEYSKENIKYNLNGQNNQTKPPTISIDQFSNQSSNEETKQTNQSSNQSFIEENNQKFNHGSMHTDSTFSESNISIESHMFKQRQQTDSRPPGVSVQLKSKEKQPDPKTNKVHINQPVEDKPPRVDYVKQAPSIRKGTKAALSTPVKPVKSQEPLAGSNNLYQKLIELVTKPDKTSAKWNSEMHQLLSIPEIKIQLRQLHRQLSEKPDKFLPKLQEILLKQGQDAEKSLSGVNIGSNTINVFNIGESRMKQEANSDSSTTAEVSDVNEKEKEKEKADQLRQLLLDLRRTHSKKDTKNQKNMYSLHESIKNIIVEDKNVSKKNIEQKSSTKK